MFYIGETQFEDLKEVAKEIDRPYAELIRKGIVETSSI
jgi:hypothetical protein